MPYITKEKLFSYFIKSNYVIDRRATPTYRVENTPLKIHNLVFVYDGEGFFTKNGKKIHVSRGDVCFFERGCNRILESHNENPLKMYTVNFSIVNVIYIPEGDLYKMEIPEISFDFVKKIESEHTFKKLCGYFDRLINLYLIKSEPFSLRTVENQILSLFYDLHQESKQNSSGKKLAEKVINYMSEHLSEKLTLEDISRYCKMSPSHLGKMFKETTGISTIDYLVKMRIEKAKILLEGGMRVSQVAEECGFCDVYYFSSCFKKNEKISPLQYSKIANEEIINNRFI